MDRGSWADLQCQTATEQAIWLAWAICRDRDPNITCTSIAKFSGQ